MFNQIKQQLDKDWMTFDKRQFIQNDPIKVVHTMVQKKDATMADIEQCAIITALLAWGQKQFVIRNATQFMEKCNWKPSEFIKFGDFYDIPDDAAIYRTIKGKRLKAALHNLRMYYTNHESLQKVIHDNPETATFDDLFDTLCKLLEPARLGSPERNSACKRINMLMRWMVRKDEIDFGFWQAKHIQPCNLFAIMDVQTIQKAQRLGLITHYQESWNAVEELTDIYRSWDVTDPLKYDFTLTASDL